MEEVRQLVQEEGREARNLVAFHVAVDTPAPSSSPPLPRVSTRKPPRASAPRRAPSRARLRSASAGRDKRSELRARYWALLFGDLQRAIGEIYNTVEAHENQNECQEVILVLENYTRDFKALGEWFRLKWEYDNTPPPQRPQSLAWEIRKTDFVRPESRRAYSVRSSPSVSGKNSPCLSGHNTPSGKNSPVTGKASPGSGKISPRVPGYSSTSPKANVEFFSNKIASKIATKPEPKVAKESRLSDIKEKEVKENCEDHDIDKQPANDNEEKISASVDLGTTSKCPEKIPSTIDLGINGCLDTTPPTIELGTSIECSEKVQPTIELGKAKECPNIGPHPVIIKSENQETTNKEDTSTQAKATASKLDEMESEFLAKHLIETKAKNDNLLNQDKEFEKGQGDSTIYTNSDEIKAAKCKECITRESPTKSDDNFADVSNDSSPEIRPLNENCEISTKCEVPPDKIDLKQIENSKEIIVQPDPKDPQDPAAALTDGKEKEPSKPELQKAEPSKPESLNDIKDVSSGKETKVNENEEQEAKKLDTKPKPTEGKSVENKPTRPAYSQAAAKPKVVAAKPEVKPPIRSTTPIMRNKTVVEIPPNAHKTRQPFPKRNQTSNKCSYPFNLTTGRTSLFDTTSASKVVPKKPIARTVLGAGDNKVIQPSIKIDPKKHVPRPATLKINEKGDKKEKTNAALEKIKDCEEYSSTDTIVTQIDLSRIESSESLRTLVPEELLAIPDAASSVEVLNIQNTQNDEEWLTVKSRRFSREKKQSKSHWANRFHQPSATTSLPTLNMISSPKQESNPTENIKGSKFDRAKSEQPEMLVKPKPRLAKPKEVKPKIKDPAMIRQKSDVTGLKTRSSRNKVTRKSEKAKDANKTDGDLMKIRLHSSLESLTTGLERSQESTEDSFDFDKWKSEFKSTFKCFDDDDQIQHHNDILKSADPSEMSEIAEMTSLIEENERKISLALDFQSDADQRKLCEEEDLLNRQIMELQQVSDLDLDTETDDTETDAEILCEETNIEVPGPSPAGLGALAASLEDQYEAALAGMSWAERVDTLVVLEALVARDPGRAQQLHEKLSQGIKRRGSLQDALRRLQAKQARAEKQRREYQTERAKKIHQLLARVEEVKVAKNQLIEEKRLRLERRLQKAAENRDQHLKDIVRKAHDEEEKLREIAFIKQLEAENRRHDFLDQCRSHTTRLRQMRRDRLNKLEQKAAREAAVGARRQALEAARKRHVESLLERRRQRDARRQQLRDLQRQERDDAAREKAEGVKSRLSALAAAAELEADALRSRIRDKQDASQQRLESHLQAIREKATGPRQPTTSESEQAREEKELQEETERLEQERKDREKQKAIKKRARKVKQKLLSTGCENVFSNMSLETMFPISNKMYKVVQQLANILNPLLENDYSEQMKNDKTEQSNINNGIEDEIDKQNKKNKIKNNNKVVNGTEDNEKNKKLKKQKSDDKPDIIDNAVHNADSAIENNNNDMKTEIIMENKDNSNNENNSKPKTEIIMEKRDLPNNDSTDNTKATTNTADIIFENNASGSNITDNAKNENGKKKAKKNKNNKEGDNKTNSDKPKLSKTSSVCSSLSDMSKASAKSDKKAKVVIDTSFLDRLLNELHRCIEKFDKSTKDKCIAQRMQALKVLGQLLAVAAEREDIAQQLPAKTLTTAVMVMSRVINCRMSAAYFITTNTSVHAVRLLANTLEKDLKSDPRETELTKQLADCLSLALDSVLVTSRLFDDETADNREKELLSSLRGRTHTLISYLCLSGCVTKAEHAGEARDSIHTLLTVCSDVCYPCVADVGTERASAAQSLRCAFGTSMCGARAELCSLFAGNDTEHCGAFVRAARTAHLLRAAAIIDHRIVQEAFGEGGWPLEFRAAVSRLLSQHAPNDRELPRTTYLRLSNQRLDQTLQETMVLDLIVLVGFVIVNNPQLQETICKGWSVIKTLCTLPANWLVSAPQCHALLPTLIALCEWPPAAATIRAELCTQLLNDYIDSPEAQEVKLVQVIKQGRIKKPPTTLGKK